MSKYTQELQTTAKALVAKGKGILAMDESNGTCNQRFLDLLSRSGRICSKYYCN